MRITDLPALWNQNHGDPSSGSEAEYKAFFERIEFCKQPKK